MMNKRLFIILHSAFCILHSLHRPIHAYEAIDLIQNQGMDLLECLLGRVG